MRADDIRKASEFEQQSAQTTVERKEEEQMCDHFITAARQRHQAIAARLKDKYLALMIHDKTAYLNSSRLFWKLDSWEDDFRRRRRLIRNTNGSAHPEAIQRSSSNDHHDDMMTAVIKEETLFKQLKEQKPMPANQTSSDEEEILQVDEKDLDQDFSGPIRYSTACSLVCGTAVVSGTMAITHNAMLFDTDEFDENFAKLDTKVRLSSFDRVSIASLRLSDVSLHRESPWQMAFQRDTSDLLTAVSPAGQSIGNIRLQPK